jgi:hypothetical protein
MNRLRGRVFAVAVEVPWNEGIVPRLVGSAVPVSATSGDP